MTVLRQTALTFGNGPVSRVGFVALAYLDVVLTLFAVQRGFSELNPFMVKLLATPLVLVLVKILAPPLIAWLVPARFLLPSILFMFFVTFWNISGLLSSV